TGAEQTFVVPEGVTSVVVDAYGAEGGGTSNCCSGLPRGGDGGRVQATPPVTPGETLYIYVGGRGGNGDGLGAAVPGGFNGGGPTPLGAGRPGGSGGGATDIRRGGNTLAARVLVAGGGGGGGYSSSNGGGG